MVSLSLTPPFLKCHAPLLKLIPIFQSVPYNAVNMQATFEDGMLEEAVAKKHSTTKEAIEMGEGAGVYRIILTHFSQRYPKIPVVEDAQMHNNTACIAFDLMSINMADLPLLPHLLPYLKLLFRNEAMPVDDDAMPIDDDAMPVDSE